ncbi:MAG: hypothetical protein NW224_30135 [Leptolyngbyaceae cyanobacterium bins.302]|nr:hypothetical protein [Leptolyngbyaceae cyanobacterium bins.302]
MTQTLDTLYWQEQEQRAEALRSILERTFAAAQVRGLIQPLDEQSELWGYQSKDQTLVYAPETDVFWIASNDGEWRVNWQGQQPISDINSEITTEQFIEFQQLKEWLDSQNVPQEVDLAQTCLQATQQWQEKQSLQSNDQPNVQNGKVSAVAAVAERLFEYYASQGEAAYKLTPESTEHIYKFVMDDRVYLVSRDDATGAYNVGRQGSPMNLRNREGVTETDVQIWAAIGEWLTERERLIAEAQQSSSWTDTYWSQQEAKANQILPIAERIFAYQEARGVVSYDAERQSYVARGKAGEYEVGYAPMTDTFWVQRGEDIIVAAIDYLHHYDRQSQRWQAEGLEHIEQITDQDAQRFAELSAWLDVKDKRSGREPGEQLQGSHIYMNRSSIAASSRTQERDWVKQWQDWQQPVSEQRHTALTAQSSQRASNSGATTQEVDYGFEQ